MRLKSHQRNGSFAFIAILAVALMVPLPLLALGHIASGAARQQIIDNRKA